MRYLIFRDGEDAPMASMDGLPRHAFEATLLLWWVHDEVTDSVWQTDLRLRRLGDLGGYYDILADGRALPGYYVLIPEVQTVIDSFDEPDPIPVRGLLNPWGLDSINEVSLMPFEHVKVLAAGEDCGAYRYEYFCKTCGARFATDDPEESFCSEGCVPSVSLPGADSSAG